MKIADFGLLRDTESEIYEMKQTKKLPIKWMAPEALYKGIHTSKSDVYVCNLIFNNSNPFGPVSVEGTRTGQLNITYPFFLTHFLPSP